MNSEDNQIIEFIKKFIKPSVIEVCNHLGPFWYDKSGDKPEEYHTRALAYEFNDKNINFDREIAITQYYKGSVISDSPKEADFVIYKDQENMDLPSGILIEAKYTPGKEKLQFGEVRFQTFRNIISAKSSSNNNINNINYGVCINWGNNSKVNQNQKEPFVTKDFTGHVNPTIELWKLVEGSKTNFVKLWSYEDQKNIEEE